MIAAVTRRLSGGGSDQLVEVVVTKTFMTPPRVDGQVGALPFRVAVFEASRRASASAQKSNCVVGEHAVRAPAVGDDLDPGGKVPDVVGEFVDRDRSGSGDVAGGELGGGSDVDDDDVAGADSFDEFGLTDLLEPATVAQVGGSEFVELLVMGGGNVAQGRPQFADACRGQSVVDPVFPRVGW